MFFENQNEELRNYYINMLKMMGSLSNLFSSSDKPYLDSRVTENLFCMCLEAENLARTDCTADARKGSIGIGIKTWVSSGGMQKIAEFNKVKKEYTGLKGEELANKISEFRNERISFTMRTYDIKEMVYHCTIRDKAKITINESPLDYIDTSNLRILTEKDHTMTFTDGINEYGFNSSKSVLMKRFNNMNLLESIQVKILDNPYQILKKALINNTYDSDAGLINSIEPKTIEYNDKMNKKMYPYIYLRLYSYNKQTYEKYVPEKSGLNQWNASGRPRNPNEIYIPISPEDHRKAPNFFPKKDKSFNLKLPNGKLILAKVCQQNSKALMSNPNKELGEWLLRDVLNLREKELLTYQKFEILGIDSVKVYKIDEENYFIDFAEIGAYEKFMENYRNEVENV